MAQRTIVLTGATDGIGLALAARYHAQGERLVLIGRRALSRLDPALFSVENYCRVDLALPYCAEIVTSFVRSRQIDHIDLLIHNAALGYYGPVEQQLASSIRIIEAVNLRAPIALTHALLPWMQPAKGRPRAKIACISSIGSALPGPQYAVYVATKAALDGFARSLRVELTGQVAVQIIHPGPTRTAMHSKSGVPADRFNLSRFPTAEKVAAQIVRAIDSPRPAVTIGAVNRLAQLAGRHAAPLVDKVMQMQR